MTQPDSSSRVHNQLVVDLTGYSPAQHELIRARVLVLLADLDRDATPTVEAPSLTALQRGLALASSLEDTLGPDSVLRDALRRLATSGHLTQRAVVATAAADGPVSRADLLDLTGRAEGSQALNGITRPVNTVSRALAARHALPDGFLLTHPVWKRGVMVSLRADPIITAETQESHP